MIPFYYFLFKNGLCVIVGVCVHTSNQYVHWGRRGGGRGLCVHDIGGLGELGRRWDASIDASMWYLTPVFQ